ncbi:nucleoside diphosphate-linked moiety X motif 17 isoform X1 [Penaeus vannamei]|uniref:nucleoside diphosphate-linked moiety X motif 17 isoform X1 n=1 Tax=Penaeus vannamei TaxID=6689 RepID=UPI00387F9D09
MASSGYKRVLVHLRKTSAVESYQKAKFSECILDFLGFCGDGMVECHLEDNRLLIQPSAMANTLENTKMATNVKKTPSYKLVHPPFCPVQHLDEDGIASLDPEIYNRGVDVGVAVILESIDNRLLLTRRAPHMRTFPKTWVPPGGHIEEGETLEDAALRELEEETGLVLTPTEKKTSNILGLWESVYPPVLPMGLPKRHHIVVYLHIVLDRTSQDLQNNFKLCGEEVDAAVWLSEELVRLSVWRNDNSSDAADELPVKNEEIPITLVNRTGEHASGYLDSEILKEKTSNEDLKRERVSTGSRYALALWLEKKSLNVNRTSGSLQKDLYKQFLMKDDHAKEIDTSKASNL